MNKLKVGIIGCGTIGSALAGIIQKSFRSQAVLAGLCDIDPEKTATLQKKLGFSIPVVSRQKLIQQSDLVIEAASASVSGEIAEDALKRNKQVLVMSVGGLLANKRWRSLARQGKGRLWIPSGALAGIDGLLAAHEGKIRSVRLITEKPAQSLSGAPYFFHRKFPKLLGNNPVCLFKGTAAEAVKGFPQNINVAAILSLAGLGPEKTQVEIWTSLKVRSNRHRVLIEGDFGRIETVTENVPSRDNLKTSALAIHSAAAALRKILSAVRIGT